jgi:hypothetical protein
LAWRALGGSASRSPAHSQSISRAAYRLLAGRGFRSVRRYAGGLADWAAAGLPLHEESGCGPRCSATADVRAEVAA